MTKLNEKSHSHRNLMTTPEQKRIKIEFRAHRPKPIFKRPKWAPRNIIHIHWVCTSLRSFDDREMNGRDKSERKKPFDWSKHSNVNVEEGKVKIMSNNGSNRNMNTNFYFTDAISILPLSMRHRFGFIFFLYHLWCVCVWFFFFSSSAISVEWPDTHSQHSLLHSNCRRLTI